MESTENRYRGERIFTVDVVQSKIPACGLQILFCILVSRIQVLTSASHLTILHGQKHTFPSSIHQRFFAELYTFPV